ncbi:MAG: dihydrofolate reductase family protein [Gemmatimonadaceae bacterium]
MRKLIVLEMVTLDGVMQAPGGREEDQRGGFTHGGWSAPYNDSVKMQIMGEGMSRGADLLFGRWTYEKMYNVWHGRSDNPFTPVFERSQKYVASRTLRGPLPWQNSTLLEGDAADAVARLKEQPGLDLLIMGSGVLADSLMRRGLVDQYQLLIHPLVLGSGRRLFTDGTPSSALRLVNSVPTTTGVIITTYEPVDRVAGAGE